MGDRSDSALSVRHRWGESPAARDREGLRPPESGAMVSKPQGAQRDGKLPEDLAISDVW